ncbi:MAG TPA: hypothetical protein VHL79_08915, partial [Ramlibacter sp.]|nr:hypothetical protein [Ramlibacter sp.]
AAVLLASTCVEALRAPDVQAEDTRVQLQGTWLREYSERGVQVRRVLALEPGGDFHETVRVQEEGGKVTEYAHEGTWLYDGTNLKRRYTLMNGKPPSRLNLPFATFAITFDSRNEFRGVDHVRGHKVHYRRLSVDASSGDQGR